MSEVVKSASARPGDEGAPSALVTDVGAEEGTRPRQVALDWDGLEQALMHPAAGAETYLDTHTGEVIDLIDGWSDDHGFSEQELAEGLVSGRLVTIEPLPQETVQGWMSAFAAGLEDGWAPDALSEALVGGAPRRSFEEALGRFPQERLAWLACRETRVAAVLRAWLEAKDIEPTTERRRGRFDARPWPREQAG
jgi:hypothetical protein